MKYESNSHKRITLFLMKNPLTNISYKMFNIFIPLLYYNIGTRFCETSVMKSFDTKIIILHLYFICLS